MRIYLLLVLAFVSCSRMPVSEILSVEEAGVIWPVSAGEIVEHTYYKLAYSEKDEGALWVFYHLKPEFVDGSAKRKDNFREDPLVSTGSAALDDYVGSGYDRGHLCPAASMSINQTAMDESFFMSNMSPQSPSLNRGRWKSLETKEREWVKVLGEEYVVAGAIYTNPIKTIGANEVTVPKYYYKIIWDGHGKVIGFIMPNEKCNNELESYVVSVDSIEQLTGIDFFSSIPDEIENKIEATRNVNEWFYDTAIQSLR
ncbi:MAG: DNA/RNA non-specific endonuclease [Prolixibacteraceae bacterium]